VDESKTSRASFAPDWSHFSHYSGDSFSVTTSGEKAERTP
jgi:hypothetical protein